METKKKKICWIRVAKNISYFIAPILISIFILSVVSILYVNEKVMLQEGDDYYQSKTFIEDYWGSIANKVYHIKNLEDAINSLNTVTLTDSDREKIETNYQYNYGFDSSKINIDFNGKNIPGYYQYQPGNFVYFVIDNKKQAVYSNIEYDISHMTVKNLKEEILSNKYYWVCENGKIKTSISQLNEENIKQIGVYERYIKTGDYTVYTAVRNDLPYFDDYLGNYILFTTVRNQYENVIYIIPITIILLIIMLCIILIGIGKTRDEEGIHLTWFDKWPIEISTLLIIFVITVVCGFIFSIGMNIQAIVSVVSFIIGMIAIYIGCILLLETVVKRLKSHTFLKTTFLYWIYKKIKMIFSNMKLSLKVGISFAGFAIINWVIFVISTNEPFLAFVLLLGVYAFCFIYILKRTIWNEKIHEAIKQIYKGNSTVRLDEQEYKGELKEIAIQVNDIAGGLSNAIEEKMKSERLKTELITNVSHDIKTPLTSIINYVDLLKKEDITTEKAAEYLTILDNKSQRLKKLTEDLVEASKASSGNLKMNMEKLEVNELIKQVSAEFADKFKVRGLEEIITFTKEPVYIKADSRYMYRVLENMYSNVSKYAMENTRVYTDIIEHGNNVIVQIKNISHEKLNITSDELMQRFVRGDTSRNTEGSGLGLSIANSLTELQKGQFHIYLDGDLFKITIGFKKMKIVNE